MKTSDATKAGPTLLSGGKIRRGSPVKGHLRLWLELGGLGAALAVLGVAMLGRQSEPPPVDVARAPVVETPEVVPPAEATLATEEALPTEENTEDTGARVILQGEPVIITVSRPSDPSH